jgi:hypothetical protein
MAENTEPIDALEQDVMLAREITDAYAPGELGLHNRLVRVFWELRQQHADARAQDAQTIAALREENEKLKEDLATVRASEARLREAFAAVEQELPRVLANLRHAYEQVHSNRVSRRGMQEFADGLIAPQIRKLERLLFISSPQEQS